MESLTTYAAIAEIFSAMAIIGGAIFGLVQFSELRKRRRYQMAVEGRGEEMPDASRPCRRRARSGRVVSHDPGVPDRPCAYDFAEDVRPATGVRRSLSSLFALMTASLVLVGCETGLESSIDLGPIATEPDFPEIGRFEMDFPIQSGDWTIWPDAPQSRAQYRWGHPLELSPFTWDFFAFHASASEFEIDPHYDKSTWDTFFVDWDGSVRVEAYWGLFKHTFGTQEKLLAGVICFVREVATTLSGPDPGKAMNIEEIAKRLESVRKQIAQRPSLRGHEALGFVQGGFKESLARRFWEWKMGGVPKDILRCRRGGA